jgi:hypothetical protein
MKPGSANRVWTLWKDGRQLELTEQWAPDGHLLMLHDGTDILRRAIFNEYQSSVVAEVWRTCFEHVGWIRLRDRTLPGHGTHTLLAC